MVFNRSLSPAALLIFLALIFSNVSLIAIGFALIGAWLVLPFAGIEIAGLAAGFYFIAQRDCDFERLTIVGHTVCLEKVDRGTASRVEMNRAWAQLVCRTDPHARRCHLALRSHGKEVVIGRLIDDEERLSWSRELEGRLSIVNQ